MDLHVDVIVSGRREGVAIPLVAVMLLGLLAIISLAVDLGMAYTGRAEAQRMADAAALAGASAYLDFTPADAPATIDSADARAHDYVARNEIRNEHIDQVQDVRVAVIPDSQKVRVWVRRRGIATWFAKVFGVNQIAVTAEAAAVAMNSGASNACLKPFVLPDLWHEGSGEDADGDDWWDEDEDWDYNPGDGDYYQVAQAVGDATGATGYGSAWRNGSDAYTDDYGRVLNIKPSDPHDPKIARPGVFYPWRIGDSSGANDFRNNIVTCNPTTTVIGDGDPSTTEDQYDLEPGNMIGPTFQGIGDLMDDGPRRPMGRGHEDGGRLERRGRTGWIRSPRVIVIGLVDPAMLNQDIESVRRDRVQQLRQDLPGGADQAEGRRARPLPLLRGGNGSGRADAEPARPPDPPRGIATSKWMTPS